MTDITTVDAGLGGCFCEDDDGNVVTFHASIRDELIARGVIFQRDGKWRIRSADAGVVETKYPELAVCDFCSARPVVFDVDAETFEDSQGNTSLGGWAACKACGERIIAGDRTGLFERCRSQYTAPHQGRHYAFIMRWLLDNQRLFWQHYKGIKPIPARPFGH